MPVSELSIDGEKRMICRVSDFEEVVLVGQNPKSVFVTTAIHVERLQRKADGHYNRDDLDKLVDEGHAVRYDESAIRAIARAADYLIFGCPPRV
jgi:hypothetical protein